MAKGQKTATATRHRIQARKLHATSRASAPRLLNAVAAIAITALGPGALPPAADACSRGTRVGPTNQVITGRSMDWPHGVNSHVHVIPRGERMKGAGGLNCLNWTSRRGTAVVSGSTTPGGPIDAVFDGVNERGMAANLLCLAANDFGLTTADTRRPCLSFAAWTLYLLSQYATVEELVKAVEADQIQIVPVRFGPGGKAKATVHMAVSDASGDSALIEYLKGKPVIHHGRQYQVMSNSPIYSEQLKLNGYWRTRNRNQELPGSIQSPDRFVRGSYSVRQLPPSTDRRQALAGVMIVMRNISVPLGTPDPNHPNISPTWWRTVIDQTNQIDYSDSALSPQMVWVSLKQLDVKPGSGIRSIKIEDNDTLQGNITSQLGAATVIDCLAPK